MQLRKRNLFTTIRAEGSILPADILQRINDRDAGLGGLRAEDYHLAGNLKLNEAINHSWNRLLGAWSAFRAALAQLPQSDPATTLTREKWLLPLFNELGYGRLLTAKAIEIDGKSYAVSHGWQNTPIHLVGSALDPVVDEAIKRASEQASGQSAIRNPQSAIEEAILRLKVVDPACGSGHFLIAAAHRMAKRLATVRTGDDEPAPEAVRTALRDVIGRCVYGVDINPMAVELCKVSLWMEALEPGKPLSFLEHRIQCGNALIGATPALLKKGIPDDAFKPIEGDDKATCAEYRRYNKQFRESGQRNIFESEIKLGALAQSILSLEEVDDSTIEGVREKQRRWEELVRSNDYLYGGLLADSWCAAFVWKKLEDRNHPRPISEEMFRKIEQSPWHVARNHHEIEIKRLAAQYQFFHWHLAFPDVFRAQVNGEEPENEHAGWSGGFDVVLGNPPWEHTELKEKEWFAQRRPEIADAQTGAERKRMIDELGESDPALHEAFLEARRSHDGVSHFASNSGRYPLCGRGRINTYAIFAESNRSLISQRGRSGFIIQSDIATGDTYQDFFASLLEQEQLVSFFDFVNTEGLFPHIHRTHPHFCLITLSGKATRKPADFAFWNTNTSHLAEEQRHFSLAANDFALLNPNTRTCPIFRSKRDAELTKSIYRRVPVLIAEGRPNGNLWSIRFKQGLFNMASDSGMFRTQERLEADGWKLDGNHFRKDDELCLPLYEAKKLHHFDHRWASYESTETTDVTPEQKADPAFVVQPRYWVPRDEVIYKITRVPPDMLRAYREGDDKNLAAAVRGWVHVQEQATMSDDELHDLAKNTKHCQQLEQQREAAQLFLHDYPLSLIEAMRLKSSGDLFSDVAALIEAKAPRWLLGWRDITNTTNERTVIASVLPRAGVGHKFPLMMLTQVTAAEIACLNANLNSFVFDYIARQKMGGTSLTYFYLKQFPVLPPSTYVQPCAWSQSQTLREWLAPCVLELTYTAYDLRSFAEDCGYTGEPFRWDEERRFLLRSELDAAYFHLYGIGREDVDYILDTFPIVRRKDEKAHGEYRTRRVILEIYDEMRRAMESGAAYQTRLDPPSANGWAPPEIEEDRETGRRGDGEKENDSTLPDFQLRREEARPQPGLFDKNDEPS